MLLTLLMLRQLLLLLMFLKRTCRALAIVRRGMLVPLVVQMSTCLVNQCTQLTVYRMSLRPPIIEDQETRSLTRVTKRKHTLRS